MVRVQVEGLIWFSSSSFSCGVLGEVLGFPQRMVSSSWMHLSEKKNDGVEKGEEEKVKNEEGIVED